MFLLLALLVIFQFKHYYADYKLQNEYMLGKFKEKGWVKPLAAHCFVHASFTFVIAAITLNLYTMFALAAFDFIVHFIMDRIKASPKLLGRHKAISPEKYKQLKNDILVTSKVGDWEAFDQARDMFGMAMESNRKFWLALGIDQMVHHLTHYVIIFVILLGVI